MQDRIVKKKKEEDRKRYHTGGTNKWVVLEFAVGGTSSDSLLVFFACRSRIRFKSSSPKILIRIFNF